MSEPNRPSWRPRISLRTMLEALFVLGIIFAIARGQFRPTIKPGDLLEIRVLGALPDQPIDGLFQVDPDGKLSLGPTYGRIAAENLSIDDITALIDKHLRTILRSPDVSVARPMTDLALQQLQDENRWLRAQTPPQAPTVIISTGIQQNSTSPPINIQTGGSHMNMSQGLINDLPSNRLNYPPAE